MKTPSALLMSLGLVSCLAVAQSTSNRDADVQRATPDVRTSPPVTQSDMQSSGTATATGEQSSGASDPANLPPPAPMSRLEPQTVNGVTYLCGGVGADEAKFMKRSAREYDMMLTFATKRGE